MGGWRREGRGQGWGKVGDIPGPMSWSAARRLVVLTVWRVEGRMAERVVQARRDAARAVRKLILVDILEDVWEANRKMIFGELVKEQTFRREEWTTVRKWPNICGC